MPEIYKWNNLGENYMLKAGDKLKIMVEQGWETIIGCFKTFCFNRVVNKSCVYKAWSNADNNV